MTGSTARLSMLSAGAAMAFLAPRPVHAQATAAEPIDRAMIAKIRAEGMDRSKALDYYNHLTNVIGPRLTGTPAFKQAGDWARAQLTSFGLSNPRLENFAFGRGWTLEKLTLEIIGPRYFPLVGYPEAWSPSTRGVLESEVVYLGDKTIEEIQALAGAGRLRNAIVMMAAPQTNFIKLDRLQPADTNGRVRIGAPPSLGATSRTPANQVTPILRQAGAGVVLRPNMGEHGTIFVLGNRNTADDAIPNVVLAAEHYNLMARMAMSGVTPRVRVEVRGQYHGAENNGINVLAEIPGSDPQLRNQVVMIGGHMDSWHSATGATDNADAVAALIETVRILKAVGAQPRRTIRIAIWGGEEQGLLGARAWVNRYLAGDSNRAARENFSVYLNDDPGHGATYGFYMQDNAAAKAIFDAWLEPLRDLRVKKNILEGIGSTDHLAFTGIQVPGFSTVKDYVDYDVRTHHTNADFFERVGEADIRQSAIVMAVFAWHAAQRNEKIPR